MKAILFGTLLAGLLSAQIALQPNGWTAYSVPGTNGRSVDIYYQTQNGTITKIRPVNQEHDWFDAEGLPVHRLASVDPEQSIQFLTGYIGKVKGAIPAIALHKSASADRVLDGLIAPDQPDKTRREAATWFGIARGEHGAQQLLKLVRNDQSSEVRSQSLFWLAQRAQKKVAGDAIAESIENDPDTKVKRTAVFALSQLPDGEGVTRLLDVVRNNRNPAVRKQAMFWLGQSKDPRALQFIEEVLSR